MNSPDGLLTEARRAVDELGACGVQIFSNVNGKPLDAPEVLPLFDVMAELDLPIWIHPARPASHADYPTEEKSKYEIWWTFGWPYETSAAMARIVFAGLFDKHPNLKIVTHHMGGMIPYFEGRVGPGWDQLGSRTSDEDLTVVLERLKKRPYDYFKMFYADTAVFGARAATESVSASSVPIMFCLRRTLRSIPRRARCISARPSRSSTVSTSPMKTAERSTGKTR